MIELLPGILTTLGIGYATIRGLKFYKAKPPSKTQRRLPRLGP